MESLPQDQESPKDRTLDRLEDSKSEPERLEEQKLQAKIKRLLERNDLEIDEDAERVVALIVQEGLAIGNLQKVFNRDWAIRVALKRMYDQDLRSSTRQRCFEFACELLNLVPTSGSKSNLGSVVDVTIGALNDKG